MRTLELTCDCCGKTEDGDDHHFALPKGWYLVGYHGQKFAAYDDWRVTHHFCSTECMDKIMNATISKK